MLLVGVIMLTIYITKASAGGFLTHDQRKIQEEVALRRRKPDIDIYDYRPSKEYQKMFSQPSVWLGYQDFDPDELPTKLYIK